ncbi:hypothetical protein G6F57_021668 [Rhizopus arrhizus]|nr:hypothetical protein G6F57_021668 [Rhizopus arrhizus]
MGRPQVVDLAQAQVIAVEPGLLQACRQQRLAAGIVRRHRGACDQLAGQVEDGTHAPPTPKRALNPLSLKPWLTVPSAVTTTGRLISCGYSRSSSFHSASESAALRLSGSCRQVVEDLLTIVARPPSCAAHSSRVSGLGLLSR